ncbi:MAG TPA: hypothetical protein VKX46_15920 [Ktedonobacteraceae bacterium]|nr:hypothetical protein [Ktedonobacteraceae bacterium]
MAKALATNNAASAQDDRKKQRKKLAKREAQLLLQLEQAQKGVQKAEQKLLKAQTRLEERKASAHAYEEQLIQMRSEGPGSGAAIEQDHSSQSSADQQQAESGGIQGKAGKRKAKDGKGQAVVQPSAELHDDSSSLGTVAHNHAASEDRSTPVEDSTSERLEAGSGSGSEEAEASVPDTEVPSPPPVEGRVDIPAGEEQSASAQAASDTSHDESGNSEHNEDKTAESHVEDQTSTGEVARRPHRRTHSSESH